MLKAIFINSNTCLTEKKKAACKLTGRSKICVFKCCYCALATWRQWCNKGSV